MNILSLSFFLLALPEFATIDQQWQERGRAGITQASLKSLKEAVAEKPESFEFQWRLSRIAFWAAEREKQKGTRAQIAWMGYEAGLKAESLKPNRPEGPYWAVACIGQYAQSIGILKAITKGVANKYSKHGNRAQELDPTYDGGGPARAMGRFYYSLPWPQRDIEESERLLRQSTELGPQYPRTWYYLGDTLKKADKDEEAKSAYERCIKVAKEQPASADSPLYKPLCIAALKNMQDD